MQGTHSPPHPGVVQNPGRFLAGVAALIRKPSEEILLLRRSPDRDVGSGVWECVTGRVNQGEGFEDALHREVAEETGLTVQIDAFIGLSHFHRGEPSPANELQGVIFGCSVVGDQEVRHGPEHSECRWASAREAMEFLTASDPGTRWLRNTIRRAEAVYSVLPQPLAAIFTNGVTVHADR